MFSSTHDSDSGSSTVLGVLMGIDMQGFAREEGSDELPPGVRPEDIQSQSSRFEERPSSPPPARAAQPPPAPDVQMAEAEPEDDEEAKAKKEAEAEKKKGAEAYKARRFDEAEAAFSKAWDLWPNDITFLTNLAGVSLPPFHPSFVAERT